MIGNIVKKYLGEKYNTNCENGLCLPKWSLKKGVIIWIWTFFNYAWLNGYQTKHEVMDEVRALEECRSTSFLLLLFSFFFFAFYLFLLSLFFKSLIKFRMKRSRVESTPNAKKAIEFLVESINDMIDTSNSTGAGKLTLYMSNAIGQNPFFEWSSHANLLRIPATSRRASRGRPCLLPWLDFLSVNKVWLPSNFLARDMKVDDRLDVASRTTNSYCWRLASFSRFSIASVQHVGDDPELPFDPQNRNWWLPTSGQKNIYK